MDQKTWFLGKKYPEKSNVVRSEAEIYAKGNEEQLPYGKQVALEETVKNLHEQIACLLCECNAKDRLMAEHAKAAQEANSGKERAEALVAIQKQELENVIQQKVAAVERLIHLNAALKNCKRELSCTKIEQDRKVILEKAHKKLESKYIEAKKKLANLTVENARLTKVLEKKEEIIKDVNNQISKATAEFNALVSRCDSTERGNNVLKHEYGLLKKELKIKSRHAVTANRQQLETERQKLRMLVKKRGPGHPKTNPKNHYKAVGRRMSLLIKQLSEVEEENGILKESACKREHEIHVLKAELARMRRDEQYNGKSCMNEMNDHFENLRLTNFDLDQQLSAAKVELKEALHKTSFLEMELEDKGHHCRELEATCLELQFQLTSKYVVTEDVEQEEKTLQPGMKITKELTNDKLTDHSSLHDHMTAEDGVEWEVVLSPPMIKEIINATETEEPYIVVPRALSIVPVKKRVKRYELLRRLLFRGKRGCYKKRLLCFAAYKV
ncbi:putative filament-like plant protein [Helianthus debilis subsp. tardiflorus]